jgi:hypothetical protein
MCGTAARPRRPRRAAVPLGDLGVEPAFVPRQGVGGVGAPDDDELRGERPEPLDLLHGRDDRGAAG